MTEEAALLRRFAEERSDAALRELVTRRIDFVYAAALRQVGGDTHLAQEVAQSVFLDLAWKARALAARESITGWLYTSARFAAAKALRSRVRRMHHETEAHAMNEILSAAPAGADGETDWNELRPVLDAAMHELGERDREAILLRFFEGKSLAEVGAATGLAANSARMRVERALEKLRTRLARRGITSTAAALGVVLANQPVVAAPAGLAASVATAAASGIVRGVVVGSHVWWLMGAMTLGAVAGGIWWTGFSAEKPEMAEWANVVTARVERPRLVPAGNLVAATREASAASSGGPERAGEQQRGKITATLRQIALARLMFKRSHGRFPVSLEELVGPAKFVREVPSVDGEDYSALDVANGEEYVVTTRGGLTVEHTVNLTGFGTPIPSVGESRTAPPQLRANVLKALAAWRKERAGSTRDMPRSAQDILAFFETASDGADYVEWLESINWPQR